MAWEGGEPHHAALRRQHDKPGYRVGERFDGLGLHIRAPAFWVPSARRRVARDVPWPLPYFLPPVRCSNPFAWNNLLRPRLMKANRGGRL